MELHERACEPCQGGIPPLSEAEWQPLMAEIRDWAVVDGHHLRKEWRFPDFSSALAWLNRASALCEEAGHHADFELAWGRVSVKLWTHKIDGLAEADFVLAARFDQL
ncbi:MAG: 4a-hydroxytetrahydrobiopterin dehydratase [Planctomycetes bacterium]|nr:4a-hydroxytetrahydrobiopterin dehydratase [Planctomycetota bacterium]